MKKHLARFHWQFIRYSLLLSFTVTLILGFFMSYKLPQGLVSFITKQFAGMPLIFWSVLVVISSGVIGGLMIAMPFKRRLESLVEGVMYYERGSFRHRIEVSGEDEMAELAARLNIMAGQIEAKVLSLQRLSVENAAIKQNVRKAAVTEERQRLARELHDAVSQQLFAISMMTAAMKGQFADHKAYDQLALIEQMASDAQSEMRALLMHLRPAHLEGKSLVQGLKKLFAELEGKQDIQIIAVIDDDLRLPPAFEDQLFRVIQEAFSNILRHAKANTVDFQLKRAAREWRLRITDDGVGYEAGKISTGTYGLQTMKERIHEIGGTVQVDSVPSKGTRVEAKIPIVWQGDDNK
ncbi:sensor histidine kinase [Bacillus sp. FSL W7-1360]